MRLTICIPTHHGRAGVLQEALESVLSQITDELYDEVEICISDNASNDGTVELVQSYLQRQECPIYYHRNEVDKGFPFNINNLVEMSHGDFCWLIGSDDHLADGAVAKVLQVLSEHPDITGMSMDKFNFDSHMQKELQEDWCYLPEDHERMHLYTSAEEIYINCGMLHTYISANIFSKRRWMDVVEAEGYKRLEDYWYYPHVYVLGLMVKKHPKWIWCPDKLVKYRKNNDASLKHHNNEWHTNTLKVMSEIAKTWSALHGKTSTVYRTLMSKQTIYSWHQWSVPFCKSQANFRYRDELKLLVGYTKHLHFVPGFWAQTFPELLIPHTPIVRRARVGMLKVRAKLKLGTKLRAMKSNAARLLDDKGHHSEER